MGAALLVVAIAGWPAAALAESSAQALAQRALPLPAELQVLRQRMETLQVSSERFSERSEAGGLSEAGTLGTLLGKGRSRAALTPFLAVSGEVSGSPADASFELTILGISAAIRVIEGEEYLFDPAIASYDGGRPWVGGDAQERAQQHPSGAELFSPVGFLKSTSESSQPEPVSGPHGPFANTLRLIERASNFNVLGPTTMDGQAVSEFTATLDLHHASGVELGGVQELVASTGTGGSETRTVSRGHSRRHSVTYRAGPSLPRAARFAQVALFIAPSGVPVRTVIESSGGRLSFSVVSEVLAIDFPVVVQPPPAVATITLTEYDRIEHGREHRELAKVGRQLRKRERRELAKLCERERERARRGRERVPRRLCRGNGLARPSGSRA